jgi:GT2 family glycosyltransferase
LAQTVNGNPAPNSTDAAANVTRSDSTEGSAVSVIIPCFRAEAFIEEALSSVAAQSQSPCEILVVEDGSHDSTEAIVARFRASQPHTPVAFSRHPDNRGVSAARNTALQQARGAYIAFLDHDDCWLPEHLAVSLALLTQSGADLSFSGSERFGNAARGASPATLDLEGDWRADLFERNPLVLSSVVVRRAALERVGFFDPAPEVQHAEDYDLWLRLAAAGAAFTSTGKVTVRYRQHPEQATARKLMMIQREWNVIRRHAATFPVAAVRKRRRLATLAVGAGMEHWSSDPRAAARHLRETLRWEPLNPRYWWLAGKATVRALFVQPR